MKIRKTALVLSLIGLGSMVLASCDAGGTPADNNEQTADVETHSHVFQFHAKVDATCTEDGMKAYYTCTGCDKYFDVSKKEVTRDSLVIQHTGHDIGPVAEVPATCEADGVAAHYECDNCGALYSDAAGQNAVTADSLAITKTNHQLALQNGQAETCLADGWNDYYKCSDCNAYFEDAQGTKPISNLEAWKGMDGKIAKHAHNTSKVDGQAASCTQVGYKDAFECSECHNYYADQEATSFIGNETQYIAWKTANGKIAIKNHSYKAVDGKDSTCTELGYKSCYQCSECHDYFSKAGFTYSKIGDAEAYEAWKTGAGKVALKAHTMSDVDGKEATCHEAGYKTAHHCSDCDKYYEDAEGATLISDYATWKTGAGAIAIKAHQISKVDGKAALCEEAGWNDYYQCAVDKEYYEDINGATPIADLAAWKTGAGKIDAKGHAATLTKTNAEPESCTGNGVNEYYQCPDCSLYFEDSAAATKIGDAAALATWKAGAGKIAPHAHNYGDLIAKVDKNRNNDGMEAHYECSECHGLFDSSKNPKTADELKIAKTFATFEAGNDLTYFFAKPYQKGDVISFDFKMEAEGETYLKFCVMDNSWANHTEYVTINNRNILESYMAGVTVGQVREDGYVRITLDTSVCPCVGTLSQIDFMYIWGANTTANGSVEIAPVVGTVDAGNAITPSKWIYFINKKYDLKGTVSTFDITFYSEGSIRFFFTQKDPNVDSSYVKLESNGKMTTEKAGVKLSKILPVDTGVFGKYRVTIDFDSFAPDLTNIKEMAIHQWTSAKCVLDINSSNNYQLDSSRTFVVDAGSVFYLPKVYSANDYMAKELSFNYKLNAGTTKSDSIKITLMNGWGNVSGYFYIYGDGTSDMGTIKSVGNGWYNIELDANKFWGDGDDRSQINSIFVSASSGETSSITIDMDTFGINDRIIDNGLYLIKFSNPIENWKTSGKKLVFDYVHVPNSNGYQRNMFNLLNEDGSAIAQFTIRATEHTFYDGDQSTLIANQIVQNGDVWRVTVDLSLLTPLGTYTGAETLKSIQCSTTRWSMNMKISSFSII